MKPASKARATRWTLQGAGDQGLMFGYAIKDTPELMPLPIALGAPAGAQADRGPQERRAGLPASGRQDPGHGPVRRHHPCAWTPSCCPPSTPTASTWTNTLTPDIREKVVNTVLGDLAHDTMDTSDYRLLVNPTGKFVLGGPMGDAGLTGRKIIVDTYGGWARHGGGAFSGKDPSKVDRSAAYAMRWVAKNVVAAGLAERVEVQVAYAIGKAAPGRPLRRDVRQRDRRPGPHREGHHLGLRPAARRDRPRPGPAAPDLRADGRVRPLRPHRHRAAVGAAQQGRRAEGCGLGNPPRNQVPVRFRSLFLYRNLISRANGR